MLPASIKVSRAANDELRKLLAVLHKFSTLFERLKAANAAACIVMFDNKASDMELIQQKNRIRAIIMRDAGY